MGPRHLLLLVCIYLKYTALYCGPTTTAGINDSECCSKKLVGSDFYTLIDEGFTGDYNCLSNCIYEKVSMPGSRFCFKNGIQPVVCLGFLDQDTIAVNNGQIIARSVSPILFGWSDKHSGATNDFSCWNPDIRKVQEFGYVMLSSIPRNKHDPPLNAYALKAPDGIFRNPTDYVQVYNDKGTGAYHDGSFWRPICEDEYSAAGHYCHPGYEKPTLDKMKCVSNTALKNCGFTKVWNDAGSGGDRDVSVYKTDDPAVQGMIAEPSYSAPNSASVFCLTGVSIK